ncbi:hypothetical protein CORC01_07701 [Colletotrichum orchidophilum]|uniref:Uncharacterized protein n=1 Tax=Colletotrichum orchidophilum TaxID=1209926 RepID=A0A1G4B6G2_9PEZI|nr:uncharacterized protein CORC01_07701 [Colletotrichum orchidophilum]OHE96916.1 hypothetical protein CORC01_07701 [Colletotrichum orchidophilum]
MPLLYYWQQSGLGQPHGQWRDRRQEDPRSRIQSVWVTGPAYVPPESGGMDHAEKSAQTVPKDNPGSRFFLLLRVGVSFSNLNPLTVNPTSPYPRIFPPALHCLDDPSSIGRMLGMRQHGGAVVLQARSSRRSPAQTRQFLTGLGGNVKDCIQALDPGPISAAAQMPQASATAVSHDNTATNPVA